MATALPIDPLKLIDVGTTANDGTGDQLRTAFEKTNAIAVEGVVVQQAAPATLQGVDGDLAGMITTDGTDVWVCKLDWTGAVDIWVKIDLTQLAANTVAIGTNTTNIGTNDTDIAANLAFITSGTVVNATVPGLPYGISTDKEGMIAEDNTYLYVCFQDYVNNTTACWKRITLEVNTSEVLW